MFPWIAPALAGLALANTALNALTWSRGAQPKGAHAVSALVPARNEVHNIEACVRSLAACPEVAEILVYDDGSTDGTSELLEVLGREIPRLRVLQGGTLPAGWVGKPHACHQLGLAARHDRLLFVDADTRLQPSGLARLLGLLERPGVGVVSAVPRQRTERFAERLMLPLLHLTYVAWLPLRLVDLTFDTRFLAANGQVMLFDRDCYLRIGGYAAVRREVVDDMAICRAVKQARRRVVFADGHHIADCRMYRSAEEIRKGFAKNLYEGLGGSLPALLGALGLYFSAFVLPYVGLVAGLAGRPDWLLPSAVGVALNLLLRGLLAVRHGHTLGSVLLHPFAVLALAGIGLNSAWWHRKRQIEWSGRVYLPREERA